MRPYNKEMRPQGFQGPIPPQGYPGIANPPGQRPQQPLQQARTGSPLPRPSPMHPSLGMRPGVASQGGNPRPFPPQQRPQGQLSAGTPQGLPAYVNPGPPPPYQPQQPQQMQQGPQQLQGRPKPAPSGSKMMAGRMQHGVRAGLGMTAYPGSATGLSGSETDVSTSTENLTQEERYVLRHMERQEPRGEENGDAVFAHYPRGMGNSNQMSQVQMKAEMLKLRGNHAAAAQLTAQQQIGRLATPNAQVPNFMQTGPGQLDSPIVTTTLTRHPHQDDLFFASTRMSKAMSSGPMMSPPVPSVTSSAHGELSKLNPSVYSHPNAQDPVLNQPNQQGGKSFKSDLPIHRDLAVLSGKKSGVDVTSSGAFFDPKAVSKKSDLLPQSDIIAQLTREMKISGTEGFFSGSSDAVSTSSGGSATQLNQMNPSNPGTTMSKQIISQLQQDAAKLAKMGVISSSVAATTASSAVATASESVLTATTASPLTRSLTSTLYSGPSASVPGSGYKTGVGGLSASAEVLTTHQTSASSLDNSLNDLSKIKGGRAPSTIATTSFTSTAASLNTTSTSNNSAIHTSINSSLNSSNLMSRSGASAGLGSKLAPSTTAALIAADKLQNFSRSQPDLFTGMDPDQPLPALSPGLKEPEDRFVSVSPIYANSVPPGVGVDNLRIENTELRSTVNEMLKKIGKVNTLEQEMAKIHQGYQALLKHSEKREALEKSARAKLQSVILSLSDANKEVTERHEAVMSQLMSGEPQNQNIPGLDAILRGEIMRKDALITQLMNQNKMLMASKERQDIEMNAQGETLEEQRAHIQILDTALSNAQATILRLEEENRTKEGYAERVKQMTRSLEQLQTASEKREAMEKKLRAKLEEEVKDLRLALSVHKGGMDDTGDTSRQGTSAESLEELRRKFSEAEEKIIRLESERTQWEQRYLEESAMRQVAIDAASIPKDAKIAALEKNSAESEKMIAEARSDKLKQFQEMQNTQRKVSELENVIKTMETNLAEKEAMIRIFQSNRIVNNSTEILNKVATTSLSQGLAQGSNPQQNLIGGSPMVGTPPSFHQKQLSTPLPLSTGMAVHQMIPSSGPNLLPNPQHQQFKSISLNSTPTRNFTSLPYGTPPSVHGRSLTPSADMLLLRSSQLSADPMAAASASSIGRSMTPGVEIFSSNRLHPLSGSGLLDQLKSSRRESAPAEIFNPNGSIGPSLGSSLGANHLGNNSTGSLLLGNKEISSLANSNDLFAGGLISTPGASTSSAFLSSALPSSLSSATVSAVAAAAVASPGGSMPKMSINTSRNKFSVLNSSSTPSGVPIGVSGVPPSSSSSSGYMRPPSPPSPSANLSGVAPLDESVGSFMVGSMKIDASPSNLSGRSERKPHDSGKNFMEVWKV